MKLIELIEKREAKVCVVGLGYVGLPMVFALVKAGFEVHGVDLDVEKVKAFNEGECYLEHVDSEVMKACHESGRARAWGEIEDVPECDVYLVSVPTPIDKDTIPVMRFVDKAMQDVSKVAKSGSLVVLESTVAPGTTRGYREMFDSGIMLAYSPEREDPGNAHYWTQNTPKLVGGVDMPSQIAATAFYSVVCDKVVPVSSPDVAEMSKLYENTFRLVNIALANELKIICERIGLDVWEVIKAAATKPFGFKAFWPGPGVAGHCVGVDDYYFLWTAKRAGARSRFVEIAHEICDSMPSRIVVKTIEALNKHSKSIHGAKVLVVGLSYKRDVGDMRESSSIPIIGSLVRLGAAVMAHDPHVVDLEVVACGMSADPIVELSQGVVSAADVVVVLTDHQCIDWCMIAEHARIVVDTRNTVPRDGGNVVQA